MSSYEIHSKGKAVKFLRLLTAFLFSSSCTVASTTFVEAPPPMSAVMPLDGEALSRLFSTGNNTYLHPVQQAEGVDYHPRGELFRPNGTYWRSMGRVGREGTYVIEGDRLCVMPGGLAKQCRQVIPQGNNTYLLIDVADNSQILMSLAKRK